MGCLQNKLNILVRSLFIAIMDFPVAIITFLEQADIIPCCVWFLFPRSHDDVPSFRFEILYARAMVRTRPHHELMDAGSHHLIGFKLEDRLVSFFVQNRTILYLFERCVSAGWSNDLNNRFSVRFPHELVSQKGYFIFWELVLLPATHVLPLGGQHLGKSNGGRNSGIQPQIRTTHDWIAYTRQISSAIDHKAEFPEEWNENARRLARWWPSQSWRNGATIWRGSYCRVASYAEAMSISTSASDDLLMETISWYRTRGQRKRRREILCLINVSSLIWTRLREIGVGVRVLTIYINC